jgi:DNA-binding IclR family transcriptional regulator
MCSPVRASQIAHALKLPRVSVVRRLEELIKHGYVERVGNAYRVTDKVNTAGQVAAEDRNGHGDCEETG